MSTPQRNILFVERGIIEGGGQISLLQMLDSIDRGIFRPFVFLTSEGGLFRRLSSMGIDVEVCHSGPLKVDTKSPLPHLIKGLRFLSFLSTLIRLFRVIERHNIHIIHVNTGVTRETFMAGLVARMKGIPLIWHVRVTESGGVMDKLLATLSTRIIAVSGSVKERFKGIRGYKKVVVIYNGVDTKRFDPSSVDGKTLREAFGIPGKSFVIGTVSQLIPWKGIDCLIKAFSLIIRGYPDSILLIVGDEVPSTKGYKEELLSLASSLGIKDRVIFAGFREDIPEAMAGMDVFCLPSISEPFGRVLIEAMAMERPVVATRTGGTPEVVVDGETGILIQPGDHEALAEAIIALAKDRKLARRLGEKGRKRVERLFTIEEHIEKVQDLYLELLEDYEDRYRCQGTH